jgi:hypothetical protein
LFSLGNWKRVCAENGGQEALVANRDSVGGDWEWFTAHHVHKGFAGGALAFKSVANGKWVCADLNEGGRLIARSDNIDTWVCMLLATNNCVWLHFVFIINNK